MFMKVLETFGMDCSTSSVPSDRTQFQTDVATSVPPGFYRSGNDFQVMKAEDPNAVGGANRYIIENADFAKGAYGRVALAVDRITRERVVIKRVPQQISIRMVRNEVRAGKTIGKHNHIAEFHCHTEFPDHHQMVFSFVKGMDLFSYLEHVGFTPRPEQEAHMIISQILNALQHVHSKGIAHRDIKLENLLVDETGKVNLIDFGLCAFIEDGKLCREWCGSDNYLAPEIVKRTPYDGYKADIFSTGVVLFALAFGVFPFENLRVNSHYHLDPSRPMKKLQVRFPSDVKASRSVKDLLVRMLEDDPNKRIGLDGVMKHDWIAGEERMDMMSCESTL